MKHLLLLSFLVVRVVSHGADYRGAQFVGFSDFSKFTHEDDALVSPVISPDIDWNELIVSWNLRGKGQAAIEARVIFPDATTRYYQLGVWSARERRSITNQADAYATVALETLVMKRPGGKVQARITLAGSAQDDLKYLAFCLADTKVKPPPLPPNRDA